jgi:hypothetical protein
MIQLNIEIDDELKTFNLPENWDEVTVKDFCKLFEFEREGLTDYELTVKTIEAITGVDEDILMLMDYNDIKQIIDVLKFTTEDLEPQITDSVIIDDEEWFIDKDFDKISLGLVINFELLYEQSGGNLLKSMDKLLCLFLRKKKPNGKLEKFKPEFMERAELFSKAPISKVHHIFSFFLLGEILSQESMREYLGEQKINN